VLSSSRPSSDPFWNRYKSTLEHFAQSEFAQPGIDVEVHSVLVECFNPMTNSCAISGPCRLKGVLGRALKAYFTVLDEYTIADLTGKNPALSRLLLPAA